MSFKHYMKSTRVMLPVVFEEFEVAYIFFAIFFLFIIIVNLHKANFIKNQGGGGCSPPSPPASTGLVLAKMLHHPCLTLP